MKNINWLYDIKDSIFSFLEKMSEKEMSFFRYSYSGDILGKEKKWGLANLVFAVKILYIIDKLKDIDHNSKNNLYKSIISFSKIKGYIYDPFISKSGVTKTLRRYIYGNYLAINEIRRAETRQSFAAIYLLGQKPKIPFVDIPDSKKKVENFLSRLDWSHPWSAGSHFSHLLFFLKMNAIFFDDLKKEEDLIEYSIEWISNIQSKKDGMWYRDNPGLKEKINGAMKILTGYHAAFIYDFPFAEKIIDTVLLGVNDSDACSNFNIVYVLYCANKIFPDYRKEEIRNFLINRLGIYKEYYHKDIGGFSFLRKKANEMYYGKRVSEGKNEPDIHGTIMFIWGISLIDRILDLKLSFKIPLN